VASYGPRCQGVADTLKKKKRENKEALKQKKGRGPGGPAGRVPGRPTLEAVRGPSPSFWGGGVKERDSNSTTNKAMAKRGDLTACTRRWKRRRNQRLVPQKTEGEKKAHAGPWVRGCLGNSVNPVTKKEKKVMFPVRCQSTTRRTACDPEGGEAQGGRTREAPKPFPLRALGG